MKVAVFVLEGQFTHMIMNSCKGRIVLAFFY